MTKIYLTPDLHLGHAELITVSLLEDSLEELESLTSLYERASLAGLHVHANIVRQLIDIKAGQLQNNLEHACNKGFTNADPTYMTFVEPSFESESDRLARKISEVELAVNNGAKSISIYSSSSPSDDYLRNLVHSLMCKFPDVEITVDGEAVEGFITHCSYGVDPEDDKCELAKAIFEDMVGQEAFLRSTHVDLNMESGMDPSVVRMVQTLSGLTSRIKAYYSMN